MFLHCCGVHHNSPMWPGKMTSQAGCDCQGGVVLPPLAGTVQLRPDTGGDPLCRGGAQLFQRGKGLSHHCGWEGSGNECRPWCRPLPTSHHAFEWEVGASLVPPWCLLFCLLLKWDTLFLTLRQVDEDLEK